MDDSHVSRLHDSEDYGVSESNRRDRLSELPNSLILIILSLLQMRDVVRTTVLSKRWRNLWTGVSCLDFWQHRSDHLQDFRRFIYAALAQWKGPKILKFTINFTYLFPAFIPDVDSWLLFAIEKQVEELYLHFANFRELDSGYCLPQRLYSCSSITELSLSHLKLTIEENVQWDRLKRLKIVGLNPLSADAMSRLLSGAPRLEELIFCNGSIAEKCNIRSTSLKTLCIEVGEVYGDSELRIWAPNLLTLKIKIHDGMFSSCFLDVPSLTNAVLCFADCPFGVGNSLGLKRIEMFDQVFQSVRHVENVTLSSFGIQFLLFMKKKGRAVQFSNAKFLNLYSDDRSHQDVLEMFPNLMMLNSDGEDKGDYSFQPKTTLSLRDLLELY